MPVDGPLPKVPLAHEINSDAKRCFDARRPRNWLLTSLEGTEDYGLDIQVQTTRNQEITDVFRVQLKGTTTPNFSSDQSFISIEIKASTARFYNRIVEPVLMVVCDLSVDPDPIFCDLYYVWVHDELRRIDTASIPDAQKEITIRIPTANRLIGADLSADINRHNELAKAGQALNAKIIRTHPGADAAERATLVQGMTKAISSRGPAFIEALADPGEDYWVDPRPGSIPWHLRGAKSHLRRTNLPEAKADLDAAEALLPESTQIEKGEYWFLRGKLFGESGSDKEASAAFQKAYSDNPLGKHLAAWAEAELKYRHPDGDFGSYPDLLSKLEGDDPIVLSARSRVLAAEARIDEAIVVADRIVGIERYSARALANTMGRKNAAVIVDCQKGLSSAGLPEHSKQLLLILKARALFSLAHPAEIEEFGENLPPSGIAGIDNAKLEEAWIAIEATVNDLKERGWNSNIGHVADIWAACASILGKKRQALPLLTEAASTRPGISVLEEALETVASLCGDFKVALEANNRAPQSQKRDMRRVVLLHQAQKHRECVKYLEENLQLFDRSHPFFGHAVVVASLSAHHIVRPDLVAAWLAELNSAPDLQQYAAELEYFISSDVSKLTSDEASRRLLARYEELGQPLGMAPTVIQALEPSEPVQAEKLLEIALRIQKKVQPSSAMAMHVGISMITLKRWGDLLELCERLRWRADLSPRMKGFQALALEQMGRTSEARAVIEAMLSGGIVDAMALKMYISIMVRCGFVSDAIGAAEIILEEAKSPEQRKDCIRLLFTLTQNSDPASPRLLALANEMAVLANPASEVDEGIYLIMFLNATFAEANRPSKLDLESFHKRSEAFFTAFPNSKIVKRGLFREDAPAEEFITQLKELLGITEEREKFIARLERDLQSGITVVPFAWRPQLVFPYIHDVVHLWAIAKLSGIDDRKFHLIMCTDVQHVPPSASVLREKIPLLDITALLVTSDLDLIDKLFDIFDQVAIARLTLQGIARLVEPIAGSPMRASCLRLQDALKPHHAKIIQPSIDALLDDVESDAEALGFEHKEIVRICREQAERYQLYTDDLSIQILCAEGKEPDGICTLDVMAGMEELGLLTRKDVASKIAQLCEWRVGVIVRYDDLVALFPADFLRARTVEAAIAAIDGDRNLAATLAALWDFRASFEKTLAHASAVLRKIVDDAAIDVVAATALIRQWYAKAGFAQDAPRAEIVVVSVILGAAQLGTLSSVSARRLWSVYLKLVEIDTHPYMDEKKERDAIVSLGARCAALLGKDREAGQHAFNGLQRGYTESTSEYECFTSAYTNALIDIKRPSN
jgi:tetratricopeptide (TPR) repeat protein